MAGQKVALTWWPWLNSCVLLSHAADGAGVDDLTRRTRLVQRRNGDIEAGALREDFELVDCSLCLQSP